MSVLAKFLTAALAILSPLAANATFTYNPCGDSSLTGTYPSFTLKGNGFVPSNSLNCNGGTTYTDTFAVGGTMTFDWSYVSYDLNEGDWVDTYFDPAGYVLNGVRYQLPYQVLVSQPNTWEYFFSGSTSVNIAPGDVFGWWVIAIDNCCGPAAITVSRGFFYAPEPGSLALVGLGLAGFAFTRRRKQ